MHPNPPASGPDLGPWKAAMGPAWDKVKASQNLRRQVADRFAPRDGSGQGRNRRGG